MSNNQNKNKELGAEKAPNSGDGQNKDIVKIRQESIKLSYSVNKTLAEILGDAAIITEYVLTGKTQK